MESQIQKIEKMLVESLLSSAAASQFELGNIANKELKPWVEALRSISEGYNTGKPLRINSEQMAKAYALYFILPNFAKVEALLSEIPENFWTKPLRVLDLGCGPGTASLALGSFTKQLSELTLVDSSYAMLQVAATLLSKSFPQITPVMRKDYEGTFDLVLAANVLNEVGEKEMPEMLRKIIQHLAPGGTIVLLEPALKPATHRAMRARDILLSAEPELVPLFPCKRRDDCPMLKVDPDNWCHWTLKWDEPQLTRQLDELLGFNKHRIKYSGFVFQRKGEMKSGLRILGEPIKRKWGNEALVCGGSIYGKQLI